MIDETFSIAGQADLDISFPAGSLLVEPGPIGSVQVTVDTNHPEEWNVRQSGNSVIVSYESVGFGRGGRARVRVVAPEDSAVRAKTASADIRVQLRARRASLSSASGDVSLAAAGEAALNTASGDIGSGPIEGDLSAKSASGSIRLRHVGGDVSATTASGDITVQEASGRLQMNSASGDLRVVAFHGDDLQANTMSGDLVVGLPTGRRVTLSARTLSGRVNLPEKRQTDRTGTQQNVSVSMKSVSGDITISRLD